MSRIPGREYVSGGESRAALLRFMVTYSDTHGYPPTIREMAQAIERSTSAVHHHLAILERQGHLRRGPKGTSRSFVVVAP